MTAQDVTITLEDFIDAITGEDTLAALAEAIQSVMAEAVDQCVARARASQPRASA